MKKALRVLIWGTGDYSKLLTALIPDNVYIEAYVETNKTKNSFMGHMVISAKEFMSYFDMVDFLIIAVEKNEDIKQYIFAEAKSLDRVFTCKKYKDTFIFFHKDVFWKFNMVFDYTYISNLLCSYVNPYIVSDCNGVKFLVNSKYRIMIKDISGGKTYQQEDMELMHNILEVYYPRLNKEGYIIDIGANIGTSSIWLKKRYYKDAKIIAFEPIIENCRQFEINCILNDVSPKDYQIINAAVSDKDGVAFCCESDNDNLGDNRIVNEKKGGVNQHIVKTFKLNNWLSENNIQANDICLIWIDVQSHESFVINGAIDILKQSTIPVYMEFCPSELYENNTLLGIVEMLEEVYTDFICVQKYRWGEEEIYPISFLKEFADSNMEGNFDILLINRRDYFLFED